VVTSIGHVEGGSCLVLGRIRMDFREGPMDLIVKDSNWESKGHFDSKGIRTILRLGSQEELAEVGVLRQVVLEPS
jgi:hypothetical protein